MAGSILKEAAGLLDGWLYIEVTTFKLFTYPNACFISFISFICISS